MLSRKNYIKDDKIFTASGNPIPDDEPVCILRARDIHAIGALLSYQSICENIDHKAAIGHVIEDFRMFVIEHPERMKEPDTREE